MTKLEKIIHGGDHHTILLGLDENQKNKLTPFFYSKRDQLLPVHYRSLTSHLPSTYRWYEWCGKKHMNYSALYDQYVEDSIKKLLVIC